MSSSENPPIDPIASAAKGVTDSVINHSESKIKNLINRFLNKDYFFAENSDIIEVAKQERKRTEAVLFKQYVKNKDFNIIFHMGLTLRKLEKENKDWDSLHIKIRNKFDEKGLHMAYFVQNGLFSKYLGIILEKGKSMEETNREPTLREIDTYLVKVANVKLNNNIKRKDIEE